EGSETFAQLADLLEPSPGGPLDVGEASDVLLSALAYQTYLGSALGYDEKLDASARACLPVLRERGLTRELGVCLLALGTNDCYRDVYADSAANLEEAVEVARSVADHLVVAGLGDQGGAGYTLSRVSMSAYCLGDYEQAMQHALAGFEGFERANHRWGMTAALRRLGFAAAALGRFDEAREHLRRALELAREMQAMSLLLHALSGVGVIL